MTTERDRFELRIAEIETGIVLNGQGERWLRGTAPFRPTFASRDAALVAKADLLQHFPFAEVWIADLDGENEPERFLDQRAFERYFSAMTAWRRWRHGSWLRRLFTREPFEPRALSR